ncbi:MAG: glycerate kinase [Solirubrobacterales bacterium]
MAGPVLIAPDSFKGTFTAAAVGDAIARGLGAAGGPTSLVVPLADGGEGTRDCLLRAFGGELVSAAAHDAVGRPITAPIGMLSDGRTAVVDSASASGLALLEPAVRDPVGASTAGTGELVRAALELGAGHVIVGAGGSATTDGGLGAIEAIEAGGGLGRATLTVLCDVNTPFELAAEVFGPQKGADPTQVGVLSERLAELARRLPRDPRERPMTGCAGGLSGGLWSAFGAELRPGAAYLFDALGIEPKVRTAAAVISGEGRFDSQSLAGKVVGELARLCRLTRTDLHLVVGSTDGTAAPGPGSMRIATTPAELEAAGASIARAIEAG